MPSQIPQTTISLRYGARASIALEPPHEALVADFRGPQGTPLVDVRAAAKNALERPLAFPPLWQAAVPGDRVVLALDSGVPQAASIVAEVIAVLLARGVEAADITILRTQDDDRANVPGPLALLPAAHRDLLTVEVHDPRDRDRLSYLAAAGREHEPVYLNRSLCEADLVVPIGRLCCQGVLDECGVHGGLFPTFSDAASIQRVATARGAARPRAHGKAHAMRRIDEVGWLLGIQFILQVVPASGGDLLEVLAGQPEAVLARGRESYRAAWTCQSPRRASLVLTTLRGGPERQTWANVARAVAAARALVQDDGAIAVCSELCELPGPALARLASARDADAALGWIRKHRPYDAWAALEIAAALRQTPIYLLSKLGDAAIEELGFAPIGEERQVSRLVAHHDSCILLCDADSALTTVT